MFLDKAVTVITELVWLLSANKLLGPRLRPEGLGGASPDGHVEFKSDRHAFTEPLGSGAGRWVLLSGAWSPPWDPSPAMTPLEGALSCGDLIWGLAL